MQMEVELGLLNDETYGAFTRLVWEKSRVGIHQLMKDALVGYDASPNRLASSMVKNGSMRLWRVARLLRNGLFRGWMIAPSRREWLVVPSGRRHLRPDGHYEEIYTEDIVQEIGIENCLILDRHVPQKWSRSKPYRASFTETDRLINIISRPFVRLKVSKERREILRMSNEVNSYVNKRFDTSFDFKDFITEIAVTATRTTIAKHIMLTLLRPKKVLLVCSYGREELITCATKRGIPTVEIQHGVVTREHLGYSFAPKTEKKSFPDYVLLFGKYWKSTVSWPIEPSRLVVVGFPYFQRTRSRAREESKRNLIVCISQDKIGSRLVDFIIRLANANDRRFEIVYKLHQNEEHIWKEIYPTLVEAETAGLLKIVDRNEPTLYSLLVSARWQIGVNSTGLFEGLALNCETILVNAPGVEYMAPLIVSDVVQVVSKPEEIDWNLKSNNSISNILFESDWRTNFHKFLDMRLTIK